MFVILLRRFICVRAILDKQDIFDQLKILNYGSQYVEELELYIL